MGTRMKRFMTEHPTAKYDPCLDRFKPTTETHYWDNLENLKMDWVLIDIIQLLILLVVTCHSDMLKQKYYWVCILKYLLMKQTDVWIHLPEVKELGGLSKRGEGTEKHKLVVTK